MARILLVSEDQLLLSSRTRLFERTGLRVVSSTPFELTTASLSDEQFDVVVLCHSLRAETSLAVSIGARRRWPKVRVLQLVKLEVEKLPAPAHADAVAISGEPGNLLAIVNELLKSPQLRAL